MTLQETFTLADRLVARGCWDIHQIYSLMIYEPVSNVSGYGVKAHCYGVIITFRTIPTNEVLETLETYGM